MDLDELMSGFALFAEGSDEAPKLQFLFSLYDNDDDGGVTKAEMACLLRPHVTECCECILRSVEFAKEEAEAFGGEVEDADLVGQEQSLGGATISRSVVEGAEAAMFLIRIDGNYGAAEAKVSKATLLSAASAQAFDQLGGADLLVQLVDAAFAKYGSGDGTTALGLSEFTGWARAHQLLEQYGGLSVC